MIAADQNEARNSGSNHPMYSHGHSVGGHASPTYQSWQAMIKRCTNPQYIDWHRYGGRGITVCPEWRDFRNFLKDMGIRPAGKTLDRINNDGNYEPGELQVVNSQGAGEQ